MKRLLKTVDCEDKREVEGYRMVLKGTDGRTVDEYDQNTLFICMRISENKNITLKLCLLMGSYY